jgi:hypothetical protein
MPYSHLAQRSPKASKTRSFLIGLGQMFLMSINIRNMAEGHLVYLSIFTVVNTMVWVWIVRTAIHSTRNEIWAYAIGSALGANAGVLIHHYYIQPHAFTHLSAIFAL